MTNNHFFTTEQIRRTFIDFFKKSGHTHVPSSPLIPNNDPTLMFVNSGMVQFKDVFTGIEKRNYTRATSSQKSVRAGGKHNDLDNVGYTARHHTFFEMLGNFSFGDYFKEEAILYAWNLLTKEFGIPKDKLYITVFSEDHESASYWKKITNFSNERIIPINSNDNFWSMGELGPCGPCSEIFYDHGESIAGGLPGTPYEDGDRYVEIWNLVFMQYQQVSKNQRIELPQKSVDTGMGLERITAVLQGVHDNYDTDSFKELIKYAEGIIHVKSEGKALTSYKVIADHIRSSSFLIADGVMPSNEGRGYVLRRIMRRAMRHIHQLNTNFKGKNYIKAPVMHKILPKLVDIFGNVYPELKRSENFIATILEQEEERFQNMLVRGLKILDQEVMTLKNDAEIKTPQSKQELLDRILSGSVAFKLYDTYGFPLDLTQDILKSKNIKVDVDSFNAEMKKQRDRARAAWAGSGQEKLDQIWYDILSSSEATEFLGYTMENSEGEVLFIIQNGKQCDKISKLNDEFILITNQTPFYGESGGQMGDIGYIISPDCRIKVQNTLKYLGKIHAHICTLEKGIVSKNDIVKLSIDTEYRLNLKIHHSATHILHAVLRDVLGSHVVQKGSLVAYDRLRFDFSHIKGITNDEINIIEDKVNQIITSNHPVQTQIMQVDAAIKKGAMALFGEKYDSEVRVVSMGSDEKEEPACSFELCGGTHVKRTGDVGAFRIVSESSISAGVRRIEAVCAKFAFQHIRKSDKLLENAMLLLKSNKEEMLDKIKKQLQKNKELEQELSKIKIRQISLTVEQIQQKSKSINGALLLYQEHRDIAIPIMRLAAENMSKKIDNLVLIMVSKHNEKISVVVSISQKISDKYHAGNIVKKLAKTIGSSGGGQARLAQTGGGSISKLNNLHQQVAKILE